MVGGAGEMSASPQAELRLRALEPEASVWVTASAGSGKTRLLTDRVIRLLISGTAPERILCVTFTRAAAAEMAQRINQTLACYATIDDAKLDTALAALLGRAAQFAERLRARQLFAQVLDVPGGMRIFTIHAFCQSLLRRFPFEAGLAPHFDVLDQPSQRALLADAEARLFAEAGAAPDSPASHALGRISPAFNEESFAQLVETLRLERARLAAARTAHGGIDALIGAVHRRLGVTIDTDETDLMAEAASDGRFDREALGRAASALDRHGVKTDKERGAAIKAWLALDITERARTFDLYVFAFLTKDDLAPRARLTTKAVDAAAPEANETLAREQTRLLKVIERRRSAALATNTAALLQVEARFDEIYADEKTNRAALDFDDQIEETRALLEEKGAGAWVLYKLDGGLDHILLDEAQDTAPAQWRVIAALAAEFFAGLGAREQPRTVFAVGDEKQSIFSFQGADLKALEIERERLIGRVHQAKLPFHDVPLVRSFRSTAPVLQLVDKTFAPEDVRRGVARDGGPIGHTLMRDGQAGLVELWPMFEPGEHEAADPFELPLRQEVADDSEARLARYVAGRILRWLKPRDDAERADALLPSRGRTIRPGDIMVLVRHRTAFVPRLVALLKQENVSIAGVDRMVVTEQLVVKDLLALGHALLLPQDDLNFACLLKSPLIGFDDDQLFALAHGRDGTSLWKVLSARQDENQKFAAAHGWFSGLLARADFLPPFELFAGVLARDGRAKLLQRLGPESNDAIDELLVLALSYEHDHAPSLQGFLHWLRTSQNDIKRDLEHGRDEVRVMTVHGAKGLQAPIVILPDTIGVPTTKLGVIWTEANAREPALPLFPTRTANLDAIGEAAFAAKKTAAVEEQRRLLYVALTRAEDRLYVGGWRGARAAPAECWYRLIEAGFARLDGALPIALPGIGDGAKRLAAPQTKGPDPAKTDEAALVEAPPLPAWATQAPAPERPQRAITPSRRFSAELVPNSPLTQAGDSARRRGRLIHRLLELLPETAANKRQTALARYLKRPALGLSPADREDIAGAIIRVLDDPALSPLFGPNSLAEVPLSAEIDGVLISGQVDRLVVTPERVLVLDYKTGTLVPVSPAEVAPAYAAQMAAYRAVLRRAFPGREIACGLLFTDRPVLHWLEDSLLDAFAP
ncbi:MAG: double-strand break repair helicase AddA [Alphaproteobacteria bacterium]|nr:double-strand break repair helicase AddA [Alphaproteobacteria bacterium]